MPYGVDAAVEAVELASIGEAPDLAAGETELQKLRMSDHPMLLGGQSGEPSPTCAVLMFLTRLKTAHVQREATVARNL